VLACLRTDTWWLSLPGSFLRYRPIMMSESALWGRHLWEMSLCCWYWELMVKYI
jgi:hypothetical protein